MAERLFHNRWLAPVLISAVVVLPCFWHRHIEAGDLASHVYNAWLVHLIRQGRAPGLLVQNLWQNVLFDWMLSGLGSLFGLALGQKIAVSLAALLFFWSTFAFVSAISRTLPWTLLPAMAMLTYGWTFQAGFFNYYLSIGFSFLALSILLMTRGWKRLYTLALVPLMILANPLGLIWFLGVALYILIGERVPHSVRVHLPAAAGLSLLLIHEFLWRHFIVGNSLRPVYRVNGADQLVIYSNLYRLLAVGLLLFVAFCLLYDFLRRGNDEGYWARCELPLQLYIVAELGVLILPDSVFLPMYAAPISVLVERLSLVSAVVMLALLGTLRKQTWHMVGFGLLACVFFVLLYHDTGRIDSMETRAEELVSQLPPGTRVLTTIDTPRSAPIYFMDHIVDRACIERCFSFDNYEPGTKQFRVRASPGNGIVIANIDDLNATGLRKYVAKPQDLPLYQIYQCTAFGTALCMRKLEAGETNDPAAAQH